MSTQEEIEQLKTRIEQANGRPEEAALIAGLLDKYGPLNSDESKYIHRLLLLAEEQGSAAYRALGMLHLSMLKRSTGEYDEALDLATKALALYTQLDDTGYVAKAQSNLGNIYCLMGRYAEALKEHALALARREEAGDKLGIAISHGNIGVIHRAMGNYAEALKNYMFALGVSQEIDDRKGVAHASINIGTIQSEQNDYASALKCFLLALEILEATGDKPAMATTYNNIAIVYQKQLNYSEALRYHLLSLELREALGDKQGIALAYLNIGVICYHQGDYEEAMKNYLRAAEITQAISDKELTANVYGNMAQVYAKLGDYGDALKWVLRSLQLAEETGNRGLIKDACAALSNIYKATGDFENALLYHEKYHAIESEILGEQAQKQLNELNFTHNLTQKEKALEIEHLRNVELKQERDRSEGLLLNILPAEVAEELKEKGTAAAKLFNDVTVLFTDFEEYTGIGEKLGPQQLVDELHACFSAFDGIMAKHKIEKIKTVGDVYLAAAGLPLATDNHAVDIMGAAIEIRDFIAMRAKTKGENAFKVRIGVHSGPVVAGIVGIKKYAYDIWGDTVNTAARMAQNSEAGKINISETTFNSVKDKFKCRYRGEIEAKNKGKLKMYFVERALL